jgi:hypothetical protein
MGSATDGAVALNATARISSEWLRGYMREHGGVMTVTSGLVVE